MFVFKSSHNTPSHPLNLYYCGSQVCEPGYSFGPAKRFNYLFHYVTKGHGTFRVKDKVYTISENEGFMIFPDEISYYEASTDDPWTYYWIGFDGTLCDEIVSSCGLSTSQHNLIPKDGGLTRKAFIDLIEFSSLHKDSIGSHLEQMSKLYSVLSTMVNEESYKPMTKEDYVQKAIDFIHHNFAFNLSIEEISRYIGIERTYLYRIFNQVMGLSPKEYLIQYQLKQAKAMLAGTDMSITEVALSSGFGSLSMFYKHFKEQCHETPKEFRKNSVM